MKQWMAAALWLTATMSMAAPAVRVKRSITLADGTVREVVLCGDENKHFYVDAAQDAYVQGANGRFVKADKAALEAEWSRKMAVRNAHRIERAKKIGLLDKETGMPVAAMSTSLRDGMHRAQWGAASNPISGSKKGLVILVNYSDTKMQANHSQAFYNDYFNKEGFSEEMSHGSVHDYFKACSYGKFDLTFDVVGPVTVSKPLSYYGANDQTGTDMYPATMVAEACKLADAKGVDFSKYDWDGDGYVDQVYVVYAGYGENMDAPANTIWPHEATLTDGARYMDGTGALTLDGVKVDTYAVSSELTGKSGTTVSGIGMACHEFSHCMCIPDMYDLDSQNFGMFVWDLLDYGSYSGDLLDGMFPRSNCPAPYTSYERMYCGWLTPKELNTPCVVQGMKAIGDEPEAYIIYNAKNKNEYYLLENRQKNGFYAADPAHGMLVLHVDFNSNAWTQNTVNTGSVQRCTIIPADDMATMQSAVGDTWPGTKKKTELTDTSSPAATLNNANADGRKFMGKPIEFITEEDGLISFSFNGGISIDAPVATEATVLSASSFTANWAKVEGATAYEVELTSTDLEEMTYSLDDIALMKEDFSGFNNGTQSNGTVDVSSRLDAYTKMPGWDGMQVYTTPRNEIRLGASVSKEIVGGSIYSPYLPTTTHTITVTFVARSYSSDTEPLVLEMGEGNEAVIGGMMPLEKEPQRVTVTADTDTEEWWFALLCNKRCYISEMAAYEGHVTEEQIEAGYVTEKRVQRDNVMTPVTTSHTFTSLKANKAYTYRVRAYVDKAYSEWSQPISVDLSTGIRSEYVTKPADGKTFDLQGREVKGDARHGMYIRSGKVVLKK